MLDILLLRKDLGAVLSALQLRKNPQPFLDVDAFGQLEAERKQLQTHTESLQARRKECSRHIGMLMGKGEHEAAQAAKIEVAGVNAELEQCAARLEGIQARLHAMLLALPNMPHASVPPGSSEADNRELRRTPVPDAPDFAVRDHVDVGRALGLDLEAGALLAGSRFCVLRGPAARLHRALVQFMLDVQTTQHGYLECQVPLIVHAAMLEGTGQLPKFADDLFAVKKGGEESREEALYLIPTAEVPLTNLVRGRMLAQGDLPIKLTAHSACFRSEAGSHGRDTRGMIRQHQFEKIELVQVVHPERSQDALEEMCAHAESILRALELPWRVVELCSADLGFSAARTYDLEVWLPAQQAWREISSISNCADFQARRMQLRFKDGSGKTVLPHTLNGSGLAVGRTLVALLENHQNADGSVRIPAALRPYLGGLEVLRPLTP